MRVAIFVFSILVVTAGLDTRAKVQNYPWCAYYSKDGTNCGFVSFEQCLMTAPHARPENPVERLAVIVDPFEDLAEV